MALLIRSMGGTAPALRGGASFATRFAICIALCSLAGCGSGDDDDNTQADASKKSGTGGAAAEHTKDAGDPSAPVECGERMCEASKDGKACCIDAKTSFCGIVGSDTQCAAVADSRCPSVKGMFGEMASCCTVDGQCGVDQAWTGNGCISLASKTFRSLSPNAPEPRACGAADAGAN